MIKWLGKYNGLEYVVFVYVVSTPLPASRLHGPHETPSPRHHPRDAIPDTQFPRVHPRDTIPETHFPRRHPRNKIPETQSPRRHRQHTIPETQSPRRTSPRHHPRYITPRTPSPRHYPRNPLLNFRPDLRNERSRVLVVQKLRRGDGPRGVHVSLRRLRGGLDGIRDGRLQLLPHAALPHVYRPQHVVVLQGLADQAAALGAEGVATHVQLHQTAVGFYQRRQRRRCLRAHGVGGEVELLQALVRSQHVADGLAPLVAQPIEPQRQREHRVVGTQRPGQRAAALGVYLVVAKIHKRDDRAVVEKFRQRAHAAVCDFIVAEI
mmetsp:Transcript_3156/g.5033  ORF Transcript_3156/g.5033 Transcript_3156/m.5033 type:complete len:321 (+) Transcript_3156:57-1019(+)